MDTLKAILNQILLFFDDVGERLRRLPAKGRRRVLLLAAIFLLLVILLMILCLSSCRSTGEAVTAEAADGGLRTRVRGFTNGETSAQAWGEAEVRLSSEAFPVSGNNGPDATWPPDDEPETGSQNEPDATPDGVGEPETTTDEPDSPANTPEPEEKYVSLKKHDKSDAVTSLQNRLMELGYLDIDEPTNYFGSSTEAALILFQRQHDLKQDGIAGSETQAILFGDEAQHYCLKEGAEGEDVKALQEQLVDLGYMSEKEVDRIYGPITLAAVEAFQKRNGLHVDGLAGEKTLEMLYSDDAKVSREMQKKLDAEAAAQKKAAEPTPKPTATKKTNSKSTRASRPRRASASTSVAGSPPRRPVRPPSR